VVPLARFAVLPEGDERYAGCRGEPGDDRHTTSKEVTRGLLAIGVAVKVRGSAPAAKMTRSASGRGCGSGCTPGRPGRAVFAVAWVAFAAWLMIHILG
jgi:hypothetical protein